MTTPGAKIKQALIDYGGYLVDDTAGDSVRGAAGATARGSRFHACAAFGFHTHAPRSLWSPHLAPQAGLGFEAVVDIELQRDYNITGARRAAGGTGKRVGCTA